MKKHQKKKSPLLIVIPLLMVLVIIAALIKRDTVKNWFKEDPKSTTQTQLPEASNPNVNVVNLEPSTPADNQQINDQKNNADKPQQTTNASIGATITSATISADYARIRVLITGAASGTCNLTLTSPDGTITIQKTAPVVLKESLYSCDGFDINKSELSVNGTWKISVVVTTGAEKSPAGEATLQVGA